MAEWVEYGSLKGPKGNDAEFPQNGENGQVLLKSENGVEWSDMTSISMITWTSDDIE